MHSFSHGHWSHGTNQPGYEGGWVGGRERASEREQVRVRESECESGIVPPVLDGAGEGKTYFRSYQKATPTWLKRECSCVL